MGPAEVGGPSGRLQRAAFRSGCGKMERTWDSFARILAFWYAKMLALLCPLPRPQICDVDVVKSYLFDSSASILPTYVRTNLGMHDAVAQHDRQSRSSLHEYKPSCWLCVDGRPICTFEASRVQRRTKLSPIPAAT